MTKSTIVSLLLLLPLAQMAFAGSINWKPWSDDAFKAAKAQKKLVVLDLEAVWCHWCHVMEKETYGDAAVERAMNAHFIALKLDQDTRPDISARYEDYGWPATIFFDADGNELAKRSGFIPPREMEKLLNTLVANPVPVEDDATEEISNSATALTDKQKQEILSSIRSSYDSANGSWTFTHKLLDPYFIEEFMNRAQEGDGQAAKMVKQTLDAELNLLDPAWGGFYQYATESDWTQPHFEKIASIQADNLVAYSRAYALFKEKRYRDAAEATIKYLNRFLSAPDGTFYTSQDADLVPGEHSSEFFNLTDADRTKKGIPRVDKHVYARENGWLIEAYAQAAGFLGKPEVLARAAQAAEKISKRHGTRSPTSPFLGDSLAMGRAYLALYAATADTKWLKRAQEAALFIDKHFGGNSPSAGFPTAEPKKGSKLKPVVEIDENTQLARFANLLDRYSKNPRFRAMAEKAMRYVSSPDVYDAIFLRCQALLADRELSIEPIHVTIVSKKNDPTGIRLFQVAQAYPSVYRKLEWVDGSKKEDDEISYPALSKAAAFLCDGRRCSLPLFDEAALEKKLKH